jgi:hypothetical protein
MEEVTGSIPVRSTNQSGMQKLLPSATLSHPCRKFQNLT